MTLSKEPQLYAWTLKKKKKKKIPSYRKGDQETQTWEYPYQRGPMISNKEHFQQEKISVFQELLHLGSHHYKVWKGITDSTSQDVFFQLDLPAD